MSFKYFLGILLGNDFEEDYDKIIAEYEEEIAEHKEAIKYLEHKRDNARLEKEKRVMGIFSAFIPQRIEKLYWQSQVDTMTDKEKEHLKKRGITIVSIPDGDNNHK